MSGVPDYALEETIDFKFTTRQFSTGLPFAFASGAVEIYEDNSTTQITAAETLTLEFDGVTGLHNLRIAATAANGFEGGKTYQAVVSAGTVDSVSVVGEVVQQFSIEKSSALKPTVSGRTLDVTANGAAGIDWANVENQSTAVDLSSTDFQLVDTVTTLTGHTPQTGDNFARLGAPAGASVSADIAVIEGQTDDIGVAGAGLTAINLPNQTMDIVGNITGNLSGSVGSVTGHTPQTGDSFARLGAPAGASVSADILVIDNFVDGLESSIGTPTDFGSGTSTIAANLQDLADDGTAVYDRSTDSQQAIRDQGDAAWVTGGGGSDRLLLVDTTIATLATQISFTLTAGSDDDDAYNNCTIVVEDDSTSTQKAVGMVLDYTGSTKTVTLKEALVFTIATTDKVRILAENSLKSTVANRQLDVTANGAAGIDWANIENPTTAVDLSGTDIQLVDTVTTLTGHTPQTGDSFARLGSPAGASVSADVAAVQGDTDNIQTRLPSALSGGKMDSDMTAVSGSTTAADNVEKAYETLLLGTLSGTPTTTTAVSDISITDDDQFNGAIIIFLTASDAGLVGQRTDITGCTASTNTLTFTALTTAPASGDTIIIV